MVNVVTDILRKAATCNSEDPRRQGNVIHLASDCQVIITGDIHGHADAMSKVIKLATTPAITNRCLIFQEIIHGPIDPASGQDRSLELLLRAVRLKVEHPQEVLFLLANHDLAQLTGNEIAKEGRGMCKSFAEGVRFLFPEDAEDILQALNEFILSMPLAIRCPNGVFMTHSLPSPDRMELAGVEILDRPYQKDDLRRGGAVYEWTWGRDQTAEQVKALAERLGVEFFILGHRKTATGCEELTDLAVTLACDHSQGCLIYFKADEPIIAENLQQHIVRLAVIK